MRHYTEEASAVVLAGFRLTTDYRTVIHPEHYSDARGQTMFGNVASLL
jgi:hypothetical protein